MKLTNLFSSLGPAFSSPGQIKPLSNLKITVSNTTLADTLLIDFENPHTKRKLFGYEHIPNALSMVYAGHQFGGFSPQLGDGRGLLLGELKDENGHLIDLHMKGAGPTPYSRRGDGRAVLRSSIREYLASEAMHGLGNATTRALALFQSDETIYREQPEHAAMLLRAAKTHIRFGHFEFFFYQNKKDELDALIDYCLENYFEHTGDRHKSIKFMLASIVDTTAKMIAQWQAVGFQHGVMNTDNMSILGETLDYGPYGFMENYDPNWVSNQSDYEARYAFEKQPGVALWNLNCLFHCFSGHLSKAELIDVLSQYESKLMSYFKTIIGAKFGFKNEQENDQVLFSNLLLLLEKEAIDYTCFWRNLSLMQNDLDFAKILKDVGNRDDFEVWLKQYCQRRNQESDTWESIRVEMLQTNPKYTLRNHIAQQVIDAVKEGDYQIFHDVIKVLEAPYDEHPELAIYAEPADSEQKLVCVSCSS